MTDKERHETLKRLKARLECDKRQVRGDADICNPPYMCEECDYCYAQGTLGERNIDLARAIEALSVEAIPIKWIEDYAMWAELHDEMDGYWHMFREDVLTMIEGWKEENGKK